MVMIFQKDTPNTELQFVRNSSETSVHNVANQQRDYLFGKKQQTDFLKVVDYERHSRKVLFPCRVAIGYWYEIQSSLVKRSHLQERVLQNF